MLCVKVQLNKAEKVKKQLLTTDNYDKTRKPVKENNHIFFPVLKKDKNLKVSFSNKELPTIEKHQNYKDQLPKLVANKSPSSFDVIGSIAIIEIEGTLLKHEKKIAEALLRTHKNLKTVLKKASHHEGEFRTQKLDFVYGEKTKETIHKENNTLLKLDVEKVYFSPRSGTERKRIFKKIKKGESVLVMFSGCGPYAIEIEKNTKAKKIIAIEKNPVAHKYALENSVLNKTKTTEFIKGDVRKEIPRIKEKFDRVIMPLPKGAEEFLDVALFASKKGTVIHFYDFEHETELKKGAKKVRKAAKLNNTNVKIINTVKCGQYSPGKFRICVDFKII